MCFQCLVPLGSVRRESWHRIVCNSVERIGLGLDRLKVGSGQLAIVMKAIGHPDCAKTVEVRKRIYTEIV